MLLPLGTVTRMLRKQLGDPALEGGEGSGHRCVVSAARVRSPGRAPAAAWASCDGWLAARLLTGVLPGALRLSSSFMLWYTATMYAAEGGTGPGADDAQDPESRETRWLVRPPASLAEMWLQAMILFDAFRGARAHTETFMLREHHLHEATLLNLHWAVIKTKAQLRSAHQTHMFQKNSTKGDSGHADKI